MNFHTIRSHDIPVVEANEGRKSCRSVVPFLDSFSCATGVSHLLIATGMSRLLMP